MDSNHNFNYSLSTLSSTIIELSALRPQDNQLEFFPFMSAWLEKKHSYDISHCLEMLKSWNNFLKYAAHSDYIAPKKEYFQLFEKASKNTHHLLNNASSQLLSEPDKKLLFEMEKYFKLRLKFLKKQEAICKKYIGHGACYKQKVSK